MYECFACMYACVPAACRDQKLGPQEMELQRTAIWVLGT